MSASPLDRATQQVGEWLELVFGVLFLMGAFTLALGFAAGAALLSWAFVSWTWSCL